MILIKTKLGWKMGLVELESKNFGIAFIELKLTLKIFPLSKLSVDFGGYIKT